MAAIPRHGDHPECLPVERKANIAGAHSRVESDEDLHDLMRLNATFVPPSLPNFVYDIWNPPPLSEDFIQWLYSALR